MRKLLEREEGEEWEERREGRYGVGRGLRKEGERVVGEIGVREWCERVGRERESCVKKKGCESGERVFRER